MIESDTKAFQSPLKCSYLTFRGQHSSRQSHTDFNMFQPIWGRKMYMGIYCGYLVARNKRFRQMKRARLWKNVILWEISRREISPLVVIF